MSEPVRNKCFDCPGHFYGKERDCLIAFCPLEKEDKKRKVKKAVKEIEEKDPWD
jgi:Zn-finger protein